MFRTRQWKISVSRAVAAGWLVIAAAVIFSSETASQTLQSSNSLVNNAVHVDGMLLRAHYLQEQSNHDEAISVLQEALQTTRMTRGLYHESQFEILDGLIASEVANENWRRVDDLNALLLHLYSKIYAYDAANLEQGLEKVTRWHVDALRYDLDGRTVPHLREARKLFKARLQLALQAETPDVRKIERLQEGIRITETHLIIQSDGHMDELRKQQALRRAWLLSSLD